MSETLISKPAFVSKLINSKKFRDSYAYELVRTGIPFQMRALREQRNWKQLDLANAAEKPRSVITRLESPSYGKLSLKSLFEIAAAFEVALMVKFVPFSRLVREYEDVSPLALTAKNITDEEEVGRLEAWARSVSLAPPETIDDSRPRFDQIFAELQKGGQRGTLATYEEFLRRKREQSEVKDTAPLESPLAMKAAGGSQWK